MKKSEMESNKKTDVDILLREVLDSKETRVTDLAKKTGLERKSIYKILNGEVDPKICTLVKIAKALDVKIDDLISY
jgi:probable addiction module antidote protein